MRSCQPIMFLPARRGRFFGSYDVPTNHDIAALRRSLFEIFVVTIMMALIVVKCVLRGRPQGGRAVFIPLIVRA
eukprot:scaffold6070_cov105-Skeletonema_dohrnii-CCMP3373.AAC.1